MRNENGMKVLLMNAFCAYNAVVRCSWLEHENDMIWKRKLLLFWWILSAQWLKVSVDDKCKILNWINLRKLADQPVLPEYQKC